MKNRIEEYFNESYAYGKLNDFVYEIFIGLAPAREKLSENLHFIAIINPTDFKKRKTSKALERNAGKIVRENQKHMA